jgi:hypothetical protein
MRLEPGHMDSRMVMDGPQRLIPRCRRMQIVLVAREVKLEAPRICVTHKWKLSHVD